MKKYLQIIKGTWQEYLVYRLNFILWRVRWVMQRLVIYFFWWAIFSHKDQIFGYTQSLMLTYVMLINIVGTIVLSTTTMEIGNLINQGNLSNYLLRPVNFFRCFIARDIGDKSLNLVFSIFEVVLLFMILQPPIFLQTDPIILFYTIVALVLGVILYFYFSVMLGFLGFWTPDVWAPRFLSFVIMEFFAGGLFPLDILPRPLFILSQSLPFSYFIYFPLKVYLGQMSTQTIIMGISIGLIWIIGFQKITTLVWHKGLRIYTAEGR